LNEDLLANIYRRRRLPSEIATMIADYAYYARLAEDDPDA
jgi:hypothetical protein